MERGETQMEGMTREGQVTESTLLGLLLLFCVCGCACGLHGSKSLSLKHSPCKMSGIRVWGCRTTDMELAETFYKNHPYAVWFLSVSQDMSTF